MCVVLGSNLQSDKAWLVGLPAPLLPSKATILSVITLLTMEGSLVTNLFDPVGQLAWLAHSQCTDSTFSIVILYSQEEHLHSIGMISQSYRVTESLVFWFAH